MFFPNLPLPEALEGIQFLHVGLSIVIGGFFFLLGMFSLFDEVPLAEAGKRGPACIRDDFFILLLGIVAFVLGVYIVPVGVVYFGIWFLREEGLSLIRNLVHVAQQLPQSTLAILRWIASPLYILYRGARLALQKEQEP